MTPQQPLNAFAKMRIGRERVAVMQAKVDRNQALEVMRSAKDAYMAQAIAHSLSAPPEPRSLLNSIFRTRIRYGR